MTDFVVKIGARIQIKEECESLDIFKGKVGVLAGASPHLFVIFDEEMDRGDGSLSTKFLVPICDIEYISEVPRPDWEV